MARFCPEWIYSVCCSQTAIEFLSGATLLESCATKYSTGLSEHFEIIPTEIISETAHELLIFLAEIEAGENAVHLLNTYSFNRLKFEATKKPRKIKGLFGSALDPVKQQEYSPNKCLKLFKATVFGIRSNVNPEAPSGWQIQNEKDLDWLGELLNKKTDIFDSFI